MNKSYILSKSEKYYFLIIAFLRICLYFILFDSAYVTPDSEEYIAINGFDLLNIHQFRTIGYPFFLEIFERAFPYVFDEVVCFVQLLISIVSMFYFYKAVTLISKNKYVVFSLCTIYFFTPAVIGWDRTVLSESLILSLSNLLIYFLIKYLSEPNIKISVYITTICVAGILLKPSYLVLLIIYFGYVFIKMFFDKTFFKTYFFSLLVCMCAVFVVLIYAYVFYRKYGVFTLSNTMIRQQLTLICSNTNLYLNGNDKEIIEFINQNLNCQNKIWYYLFKNFQVKRLANFVSFVRFGSVQNIIAYLNSIINILWNELDVNFSSYYSSTSIGTIIYFIEIKLGLSLLYSHGLIVGIADIILHFKKIITRNRSTWVELGLGTVIICIYLLTVFGTNAEFQRTSIFCLPFVFISFAVFAEALISTLNRNRNNHIHE